MIIVIKLYHIVNSQQYDNIKILISNNLLTISMLMINYPNVFSFVIVNLKKPSTLC